MKNEEGILATLFAPRVSLFLCAFWGPKFPKPRNLIYLIVRGWFGETENSEPKKTGKHYKNRGFRTVLRSEWAKRANLKLDKKKGNLYKKKPPRKRHRVVALSARWFFRVFEAFPKKGPKMHENTIKIVVSCFFFGDCFEGRFWEKRLGREFGPRTRGIWERKTPRFAQLKFPIFPLAKMLGSAAGSVEGTKSPP